MNISASSREKANLSSCYAVDGDLTTRWASRPEDNQWILIDFEKLKKIRSIQIYWHKFMAKEYEVLLSTNKKNWKTVFYKSPNTPCVKNQNIDLSSETQARYLKINCIKRNTKYTFSIFEIKVNNKSLDSDFKNYFPFKILPKEKKYSNKKLTPVKRAMLLINEMTLDEKALMISGFREFFTPFIERLGMRPFYMADASQGVRLLENSPTGLDKTTAFPCTLALAATWNTDLAFKYAKSIGEECKAGGIAILLAPGINIYRISECGRNFEYLGEDPFLASRITEQYVKGVQSCGIMATLKHFVCNNTDFHRTLSDSIVTERELHEIYLPAFKAGIDAGAKAVMTGYHLVNGEWAGESKFVITELLRKRLGFKGLIMTDWVSVYHPVKFANSGLNLVMPKWENIQREVKKGKIAEKSLDKMILNTLVSCFEMGLYDKNHKNRSLIKKFPQHNNIALQTAYEGMVLLKNKNNFLPLNKKKINSILLIGNAAKKIARGGGSGIVMGYDNITLFDAMKKEFGDKLIYKTSPSNSEIKNADAVVVALATEHTEGSDTPFEANPNHGKIAKKVAKLNPNNVIVTMFGSGQRMVHWADNVTSILYAWYGGQVQGKAIADILVGRVNPSGKLPMTIEKEFSDSPGANYKPEPFEYSPTNEGKYKYTYKVEYKEGIFVGYRWYEKKDIAPLYPFGFGLSYTNFQYSDLKLSSRKIKKNQNLKISFLIKNTGKRAGAEISQLYLNDVKSSVERPVKELKAFKKVFLNAGETKKVTMNLSWNDLAFWNPKTKKWKVESGEFKVLIGSSSKNILLESNFFYSPS